MSSSTLIEVFGHIVFSFTRGVTEHYNPEEPEFTAESFGYDPLQGTGREWYNRPVNELIYQEYSDTEVTSFHYSSSSRLDIRVIDACSPEENEETQDDRQDEDKSMAWKHLRPSAFQTVSKSLYIGAFISLFTATIIAVYVYPSYNKQDKEGKLLIALFAPLIGVVLKAISRICAQRLWNITHPGYSYVLLAPLYFGSAVMFRVLQADLGNLQSIAALGIVHGAAEVIERSIMVVIDHVCHVIWKRKSASWGSFRTPRRERLMADIAIMSMLFESTAIVSVNGFLYSYQFIYLQNGSILKLLQSFAIHTLVQLVIEWFFTSVSLAIETRYQNMPVMAIWRRRWKRHTLVAVVNVLPIAIWTSANLLQIIHGHFEESAPNKPCKMPFS
ncbi:hypothetical protein ACROYT_G037964 [Oculina patagonica]